MQTLLEYIKKTKLSDYDVKLSDKMTYRDFETYLDTEHLPLLRGRKHCIRIKPDFRGCVCYDVPSEDLIIYWLLVGDAKTGWCYCLRFDKTTGHLKDIKICKEWFPGVGGNEIVAVSILNSSIFGIDRIFSEMKRDVIKYA